MEPNTNFAAIIIALLLLIISISELRKSMLILTKSEHHLLFIAKIGLYIIGMFGVSPKKHEEIKDDYKKNMKLYSAFTIIGAIYFILVAISEIFPFVLSYLPILK
jgi:hypothetical protein